jgi:hypothetical protein
MVLAQRATDTVRVGKARTASRSPVACRHYHALPSARIKPNEPKNLDSTVDITLDILDTVDTQSGGPEGRSTTDTDGMASCSQTGAPPTIRHGGVAEGHQFGTTRLIRSTKAQKRQRSVSLVTKNPKDGRHSSNAPPPYGFKRYIVVCPRNPSSIVIIKG